MFESVLLIVFAIAAMVIGIYLLFLPAIIADKKLNHALGVSSFPNTGRMFLKISHAKDVVQNLSMRPCSVIFLIQNKSRNQFKIF